MRSSSRSFGRQLKLSALNNYGAMKDKLQDLLLFYSSTQKKLVTLGEYVSRMPEESEVHLLTPPATAWRRWIICPRRSC